ncbi:2-polyprenyl-6-methoxyphenol hydroxylase-like FAD-dependent oxidoreductase [Crossiella equi]|uniref:2-polyprenyl-6-methoxyphenol hydroxylase-like FAD-dependent oxidoreductase n=1 Tax=Crossiella equi TaxID=130796 RepID=A0ABS5AK55_9PSEU|nr:FAD-dependent oxidoreductase [Crossiella equi]MBP2476956.1 2-polyprenyl-6-methoxyphenol hydroxylase-like FAD-dependent oxidoreductase [Crossiella equi]
MGDKGVTGCVVIGGGPAGVVLGLLLARAGVEVTVLEKHGDFLRDFRGDTVHPSTLTLLDELGLAEEFAKVPHRLVNQLSVQLDGGLARVGDMRHLPGGHQHIAFVPQWDFLDMVAEAGRREPGFSLRMNTEVTGLLRENGKVVGVRWTDRETGAKGELRAELTVACDGRNSVARTAAGLRTREFGVPMDVWWFRLPRNEGEAEGALGRFSAGQALVLIDRGDYFQCAYLIRKGMDATLRAEGVEAFRERVKGLVPWLGDRVEEITSLEDAKLLDVRLNRLTRWYTDGLLCIGDAAHAMSPVGGVGINLAVQDAVATARLLAAPLRRGRVGTADLARVQRRRWFPTWLIQGAQRFIHKRFLGRALAGQVDASGATGMPKPIRFLQRFPRLQVVPAYLVGIGPLPEHAPVFARRPAGRG